MRRFPAQPAKWSYRRDMGRGNFVLMKDCSAPTIVNGRHWGGCASPYKVDWAWVLFIDSPGPPRYSDHELRHRLMS